MAKYYIQKIRFARKNPVALLFREFGVYMWKDWQYEVVGERVIGDMDKIAKYISSQGDISNCAVSAGHINYLERDRRKRVVAERASPSEDELKTLVSRLKSRAA